MGEVIKHALIRDAELLELLEERLDDLLALEPELTTQVVARNIQIKGDVVSEDERETGGVRELLNYGHTLGHAFEAAGGYEALLHGEAVSVGMMAAAKIGLRIGVTPDAGRAPAPAARARRAAAEAAAGLDRSASAPPWPWTRRSSPAASAGCSSRTSAGPSSRPTCRAMSSRP